MHKRLAKQLEKARAASGDVDLELFCRLIEVAYDEADQDQARTDRSISLMVEELKEFQTGLETEIERQTGELRKSHETLATQNTRFTAAIENMSHGLSMYDGRARLLTCNKHFLEIYGLPGRLGRPGTSFKRILQGRIAANTFEGDDPEGYVRDRINIVDVGETTTLTHRLNTGRVITVTHQPMADGGWVSTHKDVTELYEMQQKLEHLAFHDTLTGLPNRSLLHRTTEDALDGLAPGGSFAMLCVDLNGFKAVNDTFGHASGDRLLQRVAQILTESCREGDLVARMGGDEFALYVARGDSDTAAGIAQRIQKAIAQPIDIDGHAVSIAASIGVALAPVDGSTTDQLLNCADLALYASKKDGHGNFRFFEDAMVRAVRDRRRIEADLRQALENAEFELHYQPILDLKSKRFAGFEALLRWRHPTLGLIPPIEFIPVAEDTGLIVPIGEWAIREAFAEAARWPADLRVAVNVSPVQFGRGNLVGIIVNAMAAAGLAPERVEIEITESLFLDNDFSNLSILRQLHALGLKVVLDDFGTGYSALSYLIRFPFDKIKIDGSFVRALDTASGAHTIVRSVADIGNRLGLTVTAEGVETAEQLRNVVAVGYTEAQGFLVSRPMSRDAVRRLLAADAGDRIETPDAADADDDRFETPPFAQFGT